MSCHAEMDGSDVRTTLGVASLFAVASVRPELWEHPGWMPGQCFGGPRLMVRFLNLASPDLEESTRKWRRAGDS